MQNDFGGAFVFKRNLDNQCGIVFQNNKENKPQIDALNHNDHCSVEWLHVQRNGCIRF